MPDDVRIDVKLLVSRETAATIKRLAAERDVPRNRLFLQALGFLHAAHDGAKEGYYHGLTKDRSKLDTVLVPPL